MEKYTDEELFKELNQAMETLEKFIEVSNR